MKSRLVTIRSLAFDGTVRREWTGEIISETSTRIDLVGVFERTIEHTDLGLIEAGTVSYEFYWPDRWYNIFRFESPGGELRNYYCNIAMPPVLTDTQLSYIDLDVDVLIWPGKKPIVLDRDEFEANSRTFGYPSEVVDKAEATLKTLLNASTVNGLLKDLTEPREVNNYIR